MTAARVSVIINTLDRAASLRLTLLSLEQLDHADFEVVVVNGPSTDDTEQVLTDYEGRVKVGRCSTRNLSESRNIGIALAAGDVVAFIDDDAYPDPAWLDHLLPGFDSAEVAAVGGPVWDHTGANLQAKYSIANRFGVARVASGIDPTAFFNSPHSLDILYPIGTNSAFVRERLVEIGGFDEEFEYYLDETDVCCRLADRGWMVRALGDGYVYHKFLPSEIRSSTRTLKDRYSVIKNTCYFALKHGLPFASFAEVCTRLGNWIEAQRGDVRWNREHGFLDDAEVRRFEDDLRRGFDDALRIHLAARVRTRDASFFATPPAFQPFPTRRPVAEKLHVCYFSQEWPPMQLNGIARVVHTLATGMAEAGHVVHVLTRGEDHDRVDLEDGVWVHRMVVQPQSAPVDVAVPQHIWDYSATLLDGLRRVHSHRPVDVVQVPNWDSEGLAVLLDGGFRTVLGLYTPLKTVRAVDPNLGRPSDVLDQMEALETLSYRQATGLLACGPHIVEEVTERYGVTLPPDRLLDFVPHGLRDAMGPVRPARRDGVNVLYVGRLESRKGIDTLLAAIPALADGYPDAMFTIAGNDRIPGSDGRTPRQRFEESEAGQRLRGRVSFLGLVDDEELVQLYAGCDVFVAPSRFESFGLILLEAMMFAKPVVACSIGGMLEIVEDGGNGFLVPPGDVEALRDALAKLLASAELRASMGAEGRRLFDERYSARRMVEGVNRQYDRVCGRSTADWEPGSRLRTAPPVVQPPPMSVVPVPDETPVSGAREISTMHPATEVLQHLVCPTCRGSVLMHARVRTDDCRTKSGQVVCDRCGVVAEVTNFKLDFRPDRVVADPSIAASVVADPGERRLTAADDAVRLVGGWTRHANGWVSSPGALADSVEYTGRFTDAVVRLLKNPHSGIVDVFVDGALSASPDLYQGEGSTMIGVPAAEDLPYAEHAIVIRPRATHNPASAGDTVFFEELVLCGPLGIDGFSRPQPINRGNPYSKVIERYLAETPEDALILEVGGGDRRRSNPRHLNFEYLKFELADVYGDIHTMPFADDTFSLVFSQAVFEHVANPFHAAEELIRITKPGGIILTEVAFMQPLHAVPFHFFNMTPWGVQELFKSCETLECDWFGDLSFTVDWMLKSVNLPDKVPAERLERIVRELEDMDRLVSHDDLRPSASGVHLAVRKPQP